MSADLLERLPGQAEPSLFKPETQEVFYDAIGVADAYVETAQGIMEPRNGAKWWDEDPETRARGYEIGVLTLHGLVDAVQLNAEFGEDEERQRLLKASAEVIDLARLYGALPSGTALHNWELIEDVNARP